MNFLDHIEINPTVHMTKGEEYPFVDMASVSTKNRVPDHIDRKGFSSGVKFQKGDTVIARIEPCLQNGKKFYCKEIEVGFGSTEFLVFRPKDKEVDSLYLYYFMQQNFIRQNMINSMTGSTGRQRVNNDVFQDLEINLPDIDVQRHIGSVLSSYDDLIENNQKRVCLLEEVAQRLYKKWFIDYRFPGHEEADYCDNLPSGWKEQPISDFGEIITGKTPSTAKEEYYGGTIPFIKIPDMHDRIYPLTTESSLTKAGADSQKNKYVPKNSIMVSCIATVGLVNIAVRDCQTNQQINTVVLKDKEDLYYAYFTLKRLKELLEGVGSNGATMTNVNKAKFGALKIIYPTKQLISKFYDFCEPIFRSIYESSLQEMKLIEARDRLLSKIMSGEIEL